MRRCLRWHQWSLRTFLILLTLAAIAAGWWFHPFTIETRREDGTLRTRFEVRRGWRGGKVAWGKLEWHLRDGTIFTRTAYGDPMRDDDLSAVLAKDGDFDSLVWLITETVVPTPWQAVDGPAGATVGGGCSVIVSPDSHLTGVGVAVDP